MRMTKIWPMMPSFSKAREALPPDNAAGQAILDKQWTLLNDAMDRAEILGTDRLRTFAFCRQRKVRRSTRTTRVSASC
jgi:hypothetical protein